MADLNLPQINVYDIAQKYGADPFSEFTKMPANVQKPWEGKELSPKNKQNMIEYELKRGNKRLEDLSQIISEYNEPLNDMYRFLELNKELTVPSGWTSKPIPNWINQTRQEMDSIKSKLAPRMRPSGSGTTSDRDIALYLSSTVGLDKSEEANTNIVAGVQKRADKAVAKQEFFNRYLSANKTLSGADAAWAKNQDAIMRIMYGPKGTKATFFQETQEAPLPPLIQKYLNK
jgi:hypothetical protein